jgi:transmembrane sensor
MAHKFTSTFNEQIYQEACEWFVEFRSGDLDALGRQQFDAWARQSPEHLAAYLEIAAIWKEGPALGSERKWDAAALVAHAASDANNVLTLQGQSRTGSESAVQAEIPATPQLRELRSRRRISSRTWSQLAASVAVIGLIAGGSIWYLAARMPVYATTFGEQRSITLDDGSVVDINSHSRVQVRYSANERDVDLLEGEALFHVAKNPARPFWVSSATTRVRAVGTEFDVYKKLSGTVVTVVEGRVAVLLRASSPAARTADGTKEGATERDPPIARGMPDGGGAPIFLSTGEQVLVTPLAMQKVTRPNIEIATAWTQRELAFESASLAEVAEEFNRYNRRQLVIDDPTLYDFHISGLFSSSDPASLVRFLRERPGVRVTETPSEIRVSRNISRPPVYKPD